MIYIFKNSINILRLHTCHRPNVSKQATLFCPPSMSLRHLLWWDAVPDKLVALKPTVSRKECLVGKRYFPFRMSSLCIVTSYPKWVAEHVLILLLPLLFEGGHCSEMYQEKNDCPFMKNYGNWRLRRRNSCESSTQCWEPRGVVTSIQSVTFHFHFFQRCVEPWLWTPRVGDPRLRWLVVCVKSLTSWWLVGSPPIRNIGSCNPQKFGVNI